MNFLLDPKRKEHFSLVRHFTKTSCPCLASKTLAPGVEEILRTRRIPEWPGGSHPCHPRGQGGSVFHMSRQIVKQLTLESYVITVGKLSGCLGGHGHRLRKIIDLPTPRCGSFPRSLPPLVPVLPVPLALPGLVLKKSVVCISPLVSLMQDQVLVLM